MRKMRWVLALLLCGCQAQDNIPFADTFLRRLNTKATVINDYLYLDGGELSQKGYTSYRNSNGFNITASLDLSKSWYPKNVTFNETPKPDGIPTLWRHAIFTDNASNSFYIYGGRESYPSGPPRDKYWKFIADNKGSGSWSTETTGGAFTGLIRSEAGAFASTGNAGFWIGGYASGWTDSQATGDLASDIPGVVSFNFSTKAWKNHTEAPYSPSGRMYGGTATYISNLGSNGLVMTLGGVASSKPRAAGHLDFGNVHFFDPETMKWYKQATTGDIPSGRMDHCAVGVKGNGTFEIFVFGGYNVDQEETYKDIHILSLPGFVWTRASEEARSGRMQGTCVLAGKRQLLSIGGTEAIRDPDAWGAADPEPQGLSVFDLSEVLWKEKYDANAAEYTTPNSIKAWYNNRGLDKVVWGDGVKDLLSGNSELSGTESNPLPTSDPTAESADSSSNSKSPSIGVIIGAVVGSVVGAIVLGLLGFFVLVRRRRSYQPAISELSQYHETPNELEAPRIITEPPKYVESTRHDSEPFKDTEHFAYRAELSTDGELSAELGPGRRWPQWSHDTPPEIDNRL
uniref:Kelch repeat protein n=1 Tax=Bionectria ochroleuca TaxID=29856 RepID=A0A8H7TNL8_BIOOC